MRKSRGNCRTTLDNYTNMPGIVGIITSRPSAWAVPQVQSMVRTQVHEDFYTFGYWEDESLGAYVGWTAQAGAFGDHMPHIDEEAGVWMAMGGEVLDGLAPVSGKSATDPTNPSLWPTVYTANHDFPASLNGMFHGVVGDRRRGCIKLFNDRYGMKRLYVHDVGDAIYFAAEAKAILAVRPETRSVNASALGEFISCGSVLGEGTLFRGIELLPRGAIWSIGRRRESVEKATYFSPSEWEAQMRLSGEQFSKELKGTFERILPKYLQSPQPIGMSLTGGLDTRLVMAAGRAKAGALPCYTYGGMLRECRDVRVARKVAQASGQTHATINISQDFLDRFAWYAPRTVYLSDACVELNRAPDLYFSEQARRIAPIRLTGLYGDEVMRHLRAFKPSPGIQQFFHSDVSRDIAIGERNYRALLALRPLTFCAFEQTRSHHYGILALEQTQITARTPFLDNDIISLLYRAPAETTRNNDLRLALIRQCDPSIAHIPTDRGLGGDQGPFRQWLSGIVSEVGYKADYVFDYGMPHWLAVLNRLSKPIQPERWFLGRHKVLHFRMWYRDALSKYVKEVLLDPVSLSRPHVERKTVEQIVESHIRGTRNYTSIIHKFLTIELMYRHLLSTQ